MYVLRNIMTYQTVGLEVQITEEVYSHLPNWKQIFYQPLKVTTMARHDDPICSHCGFTEHYCDCEDPNFIDQEEFNNTTSQLTEDQMRSNFPGYSREAYRTGINMGLPYPYVPGDPDL